MLHHRQLIWTIPRNGDDLLGEPLSDSNPADLKPLSNVSYKDWDPSTGQTMATYVAAIPAQVPPATIAAPRPDLAGQRIQVPGEDAIHLVDEDGTKRHIPDVPTYINLFAENPGGTSDIHLLSQGELMQIPQGPDVPSNSILARFTGDPKTGAFYLVSAMQSQTSTEFSRRWITSPAAMNKFGFASSKVQTLVGDPNLNPVLNLKSVVDGPEIN